jgi:cytochrome c oxidase cbb3-type subunit 3
MSSTRSTGQRGGRCSCAIAAAAATLLVTLAGCEREQREPRLDPPLAAAFDDIRLMPNKIAGAPPEVLYALDQPYEGNAYNLAQGKRLYTWFGCPTCHGDGRGGVGPSFIDGWWLYGPEIHSIAASIRDGRPHGMPSFRDRMTTEQIWQLAGYIRTMGEYSAKTAAPGRNDDKQNRPAENRAPAKQLFDEGPAVWHPDQGPTP